MERPGLRRACVILAVSGLVWSFAVSVTGGFVLDLSVLRVSSRNPRNPLLVTLLAMAAAWACSPAGQRRRALLVEWNWLARSLETLVALFPVVRTRAAASGCAALIALAVVGLGVLRGAPVVQGSDSYGYVSQARLWATGTLHVEHPLIGNLPEGIAAEVVVPLGYRLSTDGTSLVPVYSPGLPILMAMFERFGGPQAVFYVMPLLAGVAVWATYVLGTMIAGPLVGVLAALLMATSPAFVFQLTHPPMSDIPATAWWASVLILVLRSSRSSALFAGLAAAAAILTRPNLVPLALVPGGLLIWDLQGKRMGRRVAVHRLLLFAAASIPACLLVAYLNDYWYGSPFAWGYGTLAGWYQWGYLGPNTDYYLRWAVDSQSPVILVALAAPFLLWRDRAVENGQPRTRATLVVFTGFVLVVYACYAFYMPFDQWSFLRFLLPAFPVIFVLMSAAILRLSARLRGRARWVLPLVLVAVVTAHSLRFGREHGAFDSSGELRFATVGHYIAERLPQRAVFLAMLHSGSATYYSSRPTIRWDLIPPELLDVAIEHLQGLGYSPFILLDETEAQDFVARFSGVNPLGTLDRPPIASVDGVKIYAVSQRRP
jgi:hypothetical protein